MRRYLLFAILASACGGAAQPAGPAATATSVAEAPPPPPKYVVVHRNSRVYLAPQSDAPFVQYRTPEEQTAYDAKQRKSAEARTKKANEAASKRAKTAKTRRDRLRKRWQKVSKKRRGELWEAENKRVAAAKVRQAERDLGAIRRRAQSARLEAPDKAWIPLRLLDDDGTWAKVTPIEPRSEPPHCYHNNFGVLDQIDAVYWVRSTDLAAVTKKGVTIAPQHGTEVILRPGIAVVPAGGEAEQLHDVFVDGFVLRLPVPASAIGTDYQPARPFEAPMTDSVFTAEVLAADKLVLGPKQSLPYNPFHPLFITGTLWVGSQFYATTQTPCGEYTVRAKEEHIEHVGRRGALRLTDDTVAVTGAHARAGAIAYLPSGEQLGKLRANTALGASADIDAAVLAGGRTCHAVPVWGSASASTVELCFEPTDIELAED